MSPLFDMTAPERSEVKENLSILEVVGSWG